MERDQEDVYRNYQQLVGAYRDACQQIVDKIGETDQLFDGMSQNFDFVESRTKSLQTECEILMNEQKQLGEMAEGIASKLAYFKELETATRMLNLPGENIVLNDDFLPMLDRIDVCIEYMQSNMEYKDSDLYLFRFRQCMTRAVTLIKMYFISTLRNLGTEAIRKITETTLNDTTREALLFGKFRTVAPELKSLMSELERRASQYKEYRSLLNDCHLSYFATRQQSLIPVISNQMLELGPTGDLLGFARGGCTYMKTTCSDEYKLFFDFFDSGEDALYGHLETLCGYLHDYLRPRVIHEMDMNVLSELCTLLQSLMMLDADDDDEDEDEDVEVEGGGDDIQNGNNATKTNLRHGLTFSFLIESILQDTQARLVFRASNYLASDVANFVPTANDLDYPEKLKGQQVTRGQGEKTDEVVSIVNRAEKSTWYPTLNRTMWLLRKLYGFVNNSIFEDIAQEAVTLCRASLVSAADMVKTRNSAIDGQLFLIRHLLALKEQTVLFDTRFVHSTRDLDFSQVTDALNNILRNTSTLFNPNALLGLARHAASIPRVVESYQDARAEVDDSLRKACEEYVLEAARSALQPLSEWLGIANAWKMRQEMSTDVERMSSQEFGKLSHVVEVVEDTKVAIQRCFKLNIDRMDAYIGDEKTQGVLMKPMMDQVLDTYESFYDIIQRDFSNDEARSKVPSIIEMKEWLEGTLEECRRTSVES